MRDRKSEHLLIKGRRHGRDEVSAGAWWARQGDEGLVISSFEVVSPSPLITDVQVFRILALRTGLSATATIVDENQTRRFARTNLALAKEPRVPGGEW